MRALPWQISLFLAVLCTFCVVGMISIGAWGVAIFNAVAATVNYIAAYLNYDETN